MQRGNLGVRRPLDLEDLAASGAAGNDTDIATRQAQRLAPDNVNLYYLLGTAYQQAGNLPEALAAYRKCTSGDYAAVSRNHVKKLEKKLEKN